MFYNSALNSSCLRVEALHLDARPDVEAVDRGVGQSAWRHRHSDKGDNLRGGGRGVGVVVEG